MKKLIVILVVAVIGLAILAGFGGYYVRQDEVDQYRQELRVVEKQYLDTYTELEVTNTELETTKIEVEATKMELGATQSKLENSEKNMAAIWEELKATRLDFQRTKDELNTVLKKLGKGLQWWPSVEALEKWLEENRLPIIADSEGRIDLINPRHDPRYDCDDYADDLVKAAERGDYRLMEIPVENGRVAVWGTKVTDTLKPHIGTWTKIGNIYYYVESIPPHHVTKIGPAD